MAWSSSSLHICVRKLTRTSRLHMAAKLQGCKVARPQGCRAARLHGCSRAAALQGCRAAGAQGRRAAGLQGCRAAGLQGCRRFIFLRETGTRNISRSSFAEKQFRSQALSQDGMVVVVVAHLCSQADSDIAPPRGCNAARLQGCRAAGLQGCKAAWL